MASTKKQGDPGSPRQHRRHMRRLKRLQAGAPDLGRRNCPPAERHEAS